MIEAENSIYSTISELIKCNRLVFKHALHVVKPGPQKQAPHPCPDAEEMLEEIAKDKLAPAHAIAKGLLHKLCKHGLNKDIASLFEKPAQFTSGVNAKYKGQTVRH